MHPIIVKTFCGLSKEYYFRQFFFGLILLALYMVMAFQFSAGAPFGMILMVVLNTLLYPYARFVYESVVGFIMGDNVFFVNAFLMMFVKLMTMMICWCLAIFIAPVGLAYLYYRHSKNKVNSQ